MKEIDINQAIQSATGLNQSDFCNDLNAMHEAEKGLPALPYLYRLGDVACGDYNAVATSGKLAQLIKATARQRAEAFLRTIGKWKDE